jgi:hypothetical protein
LLEVSEVPPEELDDDYGKFEPVKLRIKLRAGLSPSLAWTTLVHELIEALDEFYQLGLGETQIDVLAQGLVQALVPVLGLEPEPEDEDGDGGGHGR